MGILFAALRRGVGLLAGFVTAVMAVLASAFPVNAGSWSDGLFDPASAYSWHGFYAGINTGWGWSSATQNSITAPPAIYDFSQGGTVIGATVGFNWQARGFVIGVEADLASALINDTGAFCPTACDTSITSLGTLRPRIGFAFGNFMPYLTGGFAWGGVKATQAGFTTSRWQQGSVIGVGVEAMLSPNWSAKSEFLRIKLNTSNDPLVLPVFTQNSISLVRIGLNYHFNPQARPSMAAPAARDDWTGVYFGVNGGWGWANVGHLGTTLPGVGFYQFRQSGGEFGGTIGMNWQSGKFVFGIEGDWDWADINGSGLNAPGPVCPTGCFTSVRSLGTLRPRVGITLGSLMPYLTGGLGWGIITAGEPGFANSHWQPGRVAGVGAEWMFAPNWSAKAELLVVRLNDSSYTAATPVAVNQRDISIVRAGINYHPAGCFLGLC